GDIAIGEAGRGVEQPGPGRYADTTTKRAVPIDRCGSRGEIADSVGGRRTPQVRGLQVGFKSEDCGPLLPIVAPMDARYPAARRSGVRSEDSAAGLARDRAPLQSGQRRDRQAN